MSEGGGRGKRGHEGGGRGGGGKKHRPYFSKAASYGSGQAIPFKSRGLLITCDGGREQRGWQEIRTVLEEHYAKLLPSNQQQEGASSSGADASKDISALIAQEVTDLKDKSKRVFQFHDTGIRGAFYVIFPNEPDTPGPTEVAISICEEAKATQQLRAKSCHKLLPVNASCAANMEEIKKLAPQLLAPEFSEEPDAPCVQFAVEFEHRACDSFNRMEVIDIFAQGIKCPPHKVNLRQPEKTIIVQLIRNSCAIAIVPSFRELLKFNLQQLTMPPEEKEARKAREAQAEAAAARSRAAAAAAAAADAPAAGKKEASKEAAVAPEGGAAGDAAAKKEGGEQAVDKADGGD